MRWLGDKRFVGTCGAGCEWGEDETKLAYGELGDTREDLRTPSHPTRDMSLAEGTQGGYLTALATRGHPSSGKTQATSRWSTKVG